MGRVPQVNKIKLKKQIKSATRKGMALICFATDYGGKTGLVGCFYPQMSSACRKKETDRVLHINKHMASSSQVQAPIELAQFELADKIQFSYWRPAETLEAILDITQFKRGRGGKSLNAILKCRDITFKDPLYHRRLRHVRQDLKILIEMGLIVRTIAHTYWPKEWFRDNMRSQGISFLPIVL